MLNQSCNSVNLISSWCIILFIDCRSLFTSTILFRILISKSCVRLACSFSFLKCYCQVVLVASFCWLPSRLLSCSFWLEEVSYHEGSSSHTKEWQGSSRNWCWSQAGNLNFSLVAAKKLILLTTCGSLEVGLSLVKPSDENTGQMTL